ncbi:unnamed protein product [Cylicostephanus goldi]|uniref:N-acetyltransferase domain-containing protein n=1 Tax=Cylicostephanus goldi TaxID=71465 RepID=A0A3P7MKY2_CYLGO|nr:unnamed protein product [Cylicostephanus goldi]
MIEANTDDTLVKAQIDFENHDCAEEIKNGPYKEHKANAIKVLADALEDSLLRIIGKHKKMLKIHILCIHKDYVGKGLGKELVRRTVEIAQAEECEWVVTAAMATVTQNLFAKVR